MIQKMKKVKAKGYKLTKETFEVKAMKRNRKTLFLNGVPGLELGNNFELLSNKLKNTKTKNVSFEKYLISVYKKQEWVLKELKILGTSADTFAECILQLTASGKVKNHIILGCYYGYMVEMYPTYNRKLFVFLRRGAEWHNLPRYKEYTLVCK